jgi:soluble lytic murein transglycosylase
LNKNGTLSLGRRLALGASVVAVCTAAAAQQAATPGPGSGPVPYTSLTPTSDVAGIRAVMAAARVGDIAAGRAAINAMSDPLARKIGLWALADTSADSLSFSEIDQARREMAGWPRESRRVIAAEKQLAVSGLGPTAVIQWFGGQQPQTAEGAMALAQALADTNQTPAASELIRRFWRDEVFEADVQARMLARYGLWLTPADHARRTDVLLYGAQGPAARDMVRLLSAEDAATASVRIALRGGAAAAEGAFAALTPAQQLSPGVAFERAGFLRRRDRVEEAMGLASYMPQAPVLSVAGRIWSERRVLIAHALRAGRTETAYALAANTGITAGADGAEAEFYAGWLALNRMRDPAKAEKHFAALAGIGSSPITRGRALYWQGLTARALGDPVAAAAFFGEGATHQTTFYGQLAAENAGIKVMNLGSDPVITPEHRARFEANEMVRAARLLNSAGAVDAFKAFVLAADDVVDTLEDQAMLVDLALSTGDQDLAMRAARAAATRGFILPERGYPLMAPPAIRTSAEPAFTLSIARQESNFYPAARSHANARGMMQLLPATARITARSIGEPYSEARLTTDPLYNMRLGSSYLGQMIDRFSGSYIMAAAAYNAGPGRPADWVNFCGDPRGASVNPLDFIECIPFSETRNYVMRTLETTMVYRARLNGGTTPFSLSSELKRGAYGYQPAAVAQAPTEVAAGDNVVNR